MYQHAYEESKKFGGKKYALNLSAPWPRAILAPPVLLYTFFFEEEFIMLHFNANTFIIIPLCKCSSLCHDSIGKKIWKNVSF